MSDCGRRPCIGATLIPELPTALTRVEWLFTSQEKGKTIEPEHYEDVTSITEHKSAPKAPLSVFSYIEDDTDFYDFDNDDEGQATE